TKQEWHQQSCKWLSAGQYRNDLKPIFCPKSQSLFHRVQLDPLEKDWLRSSAVGNVAAQRLLLTQEPGLVLKKVNIGN
ncbi:hypothetical protein XENOCAPTIV_003513, partial [Xenoophorus captivus]